MRLRNAQTALVTGAPPMLLSLLFLSVSESACDAEIWNRRKSSFVGIMLTAYLRWRFQIISNAVNLHSYCGGDGDGGLPLKAKHCDQSSKSLEGLEGQLIINPFRACVKSSCGDTCSCKLLSALTL